MNITTALRLFRDYQKSNIKPSTLIGYRYLLDNFEELFGERNLGSISGEKIFQFLDLLTENDCRSTKRHRYSQLKAFFNFIIMNYELDLKNPVDSPLMRKTFCQ
ncbi:MAG: site-specific integrase [Thermoplasmata archaeon]|nr:MAG: site-specific integrase [Thermoplasmata archaeon]